MNRVSAVNSKLLFGAFRGLTMRPFCVSTQLNAGKSSQSKGKTPTGRLDDKWETTKGESVEPQAQPSSNAAEDPYARFPNDRNPETGEIGGPRGPEPTRYGDWERKGRVIDF
ncbi:hypothetical protein CAPTEDRAFT_157552 [Capitella teleta]|uniref:Succinate dehydrogenase assembly factor 4, mitochondrial n=1 Tax=Capitella teleta TaxID=283909 RepID=R7TUY7_CAPTE|nr:hypothetical protein CAPTEDRAFT_157552 [Capitella teleta]|eukprot:ELT97534.1 hypothetical protein CAPTEDRAFT_157552 [Capitella teleta]